jgi:TonB family protein
MDWPDDEFETFLRQFQPRPPKALPTHRPAVTLLAWAAAAAVVLAVAVQMWPASTTTDGAGQGSQGDTRQAASDDLPNAAAAPRSSETLQNVKPEASRMPAAGRAVQRLNVGGPVAPPVKLVDVPPVYPDTARLAEIDGVVILRIVIGQDGSVIDAWVIRSIPELDQAALDAVRQWQYETTLLNGEPVEIEMDVVINFTLR